MSTYLLLLACSQRKRADQGQLSATDRYNGPQFQVWRKFRREQPAEAQAVAVYILSAKFGLIPGNKPIPDYDYKMTPERAYELCPQVLDSFKRCLEENHYEECFIGLGKTYWQAMAGYEHVVPPGLRIIVSQGSQGRRQTELYDWLHSKLPDNSLSKTPKLPPGKAYLRGAEISLAPDQVLDKARRLLAAEQGNPANHQAWYVQVDEQRVAAKWLVSRLMGLPVGSFHSGEARRVLRQLGVEVKRV